MKAWIGDKFIDVVITTGGTRLYRARRHAGSVEPLFEKRMDGFSTLFTMISVPKIGTSAIQTRATAGVANATYVFCLPGSPGACKDAWETRSWYTSSTTATGRAISSKSCRGSTSTCGGPKAKGATA